MPGRRGGGQETVCRSAPRAWITARPTARPTPFPRPGRLGGIRHCSRQSETICLPAYSPLRPNGNLSAVHPQGNPRTDCRVRQSGNFHSRSVSPQSPAAARSRRDPARVPDPRHKAVPSRSMRRTYHIPTRRSCRKQNSVATAKPLGLFGRRTGRSRPAVECRLGVLEQAAFRAFASISNSVLLQMNVLSCRPGSDIRGGTYFVRR